MGGSFLSICLGLDESGKKKEGGVLQPKGEKKPLQTVSEKGGNYEGKKRGG